MPASGDSLFRAAGACLLASLPADKIALLAAVSAAWNAGGLLLPSISDFGPPSEPGRPVRPELVHPARVPKRGLGSEDGRRALIHALAHIEFNAINLALDHVCRFAGQPHEYYSDWLHVACEEAEHFQLLEIRLDELGIAYGDLPAHDGLWELALKTADDVLKRMALCPRLVEARGLDVSPGMIERLEAAGDARSVEILKRILHDEIGHVAIGSRWYRHLCAQRGLDSELEFISLARSYAKGNLRGPFNLDARRQAGFSESELAWLKKKEDGVNDLRPVAADGRCFDRSHR